MGDNEQEWGVLYNFLNASTSSVGNEVTQYNRTKEVSNLSLQGVVGEERF